MQKHSNTFPYLVIRAFSACYAIRHNLKGKTKTDLIAEAKIIAKQYNRGVCLVLGSKQGVYIEPDGKTDYESDDIPTGGFVL